MQLYSSAGNNYTTNKNTSNYVFKNSTENCLTVNNIYPSGYTFQDINTVPSFFSPAGGVIIRDVFNGINADGDWKLVFCSSSSFSQNRHNFVSASLIFGTGVFDHEVRTTESGLCANGVGAVQWYGTSSCFNNQAGKVSADQTADNKVYPGNNPGGSCAWNNENNYTTYIKFTPTKTPVTITIQGNDDTYRRLQTIVLKPNNTNIDPCTSVTAVSWTVVSCPRNSIYTTEAGSDKAQTHTFSVTPGEDYYLAVDGSGAYANTNFTLSGDIGVQSPLPITLTSFSGNCEKDGIQLSWTTATETNVNYFEVERSRDGQTWEVVATINAVGNASTANTYRAVDANGFETLYYRLRSVDNDGTSETFNPIAVSCHIENSTWSIYPVPVTNKATVTINAMEKAHTALAITDASGRLVLSQEITVEAGTNLYELDMQKLAKGTYIIRVQDKNYPPLKLLKVE